LRLPDKTVRSSLVHEAFTPDADFR